MTNEQAKLIETREDISVIAKKIVKEHPTAIQFRNSLKYVQGSTSMSLEKMTTALDALCVSCCLEGLKHALKA